MLTTNLNYLPKVKNQYESLPYPAKNPEDDHKRLERTWLDSLPMINHYCFSGKQSFQKNFRVLVAGGGTGDATIFLAQQLCDTNAEIVHLDLSEASIAIARQRAKIRGLNNITWIQDSLLNIPNLNLGKFDYINCVGVLHHLSDPDSGMRALLGVLADDGSMGVMVYATTGRTGVYQMQSLMRLVNQGIDDIPQEIANTRDILSCLPSSNWFKRGEDLVGDHRAGDAGLYDLLLHSQDRSYTVGELFNWLEDIHGMHLTFSDVQRGRSPYLPKMVLGRKPPALLTAICQLPRRCQYEMAELMIGNITMHTFYITRNDKCAAPYGDVDYVPFYFHEPLTGEIASKVFGINRGQPFILNHSHSGVSVKVNPGKYGGKILAMIDGRRSFGEIFEQFRVNWHGQSTAPDNQTLFADFAESFDVLNALDRILLIHRESNFSVSKV